jgi:hypothetical protein
MFLRSVSAGHRWPSHKLNLLNAISIYNALLPPLLVEKLYMSVLVLSVMGKRSHYSRE